MSRFLLRASAEADLADIWRFTATQWSETQADRYHEGIVEALTVLASGHVQGRHCDEIRPGYRRYNVGSHVIFYRAAGDDIDVVRILHARRDFRRHLPGAE